MIKALTDRQKETLYLLKADPQISLRELADTLDIKLATVQNRIRVLIDKGYLKKRKVKSRSQPPPWEVV